KTGIELRAQVSIRQPQRSALLFLAASAAHWAYCSSQQTDRVAHTAFTQYRNGIRGSGVNGHWPASRIFRLACDPAELQDQQTVGDNRGVTPFGSSVLIG